MSTWQPIETAPKDGKDVLLYARISGEQFVAWYDEYWKYSETDSCSHMVKNPTHWMPLPNPPEAA